jgi:hypothetical protein
VPAGYSVGHVLAGTLVVTAITRNWEDPEVARECCRWYHGGTARGNGAFGDDQSWTRTATIARPGGVGSWK